jgi:pimeloyl-ACP methyl ester carboxylesterase
VVTELAVRRRDLRAHRRLVRQPRLRRRHHPVLSPCFRLADGDPALEPIEQRLAARPTIAAPTINLHGEVNGVGPPESSANHARFFTGPYQRRVIPRAGHNLPQEVPAIVSEATLELIKATA